MCDDSRSERHYWMRRVKELQAQMEREDLARLHAKSAPAAAVPKEHAAVPVWRSDLSGVAGRGWAIAGIVAGVVVAVSVLLFSVPSPAATFVTAYAWVEIVTFD